jgi:hypothetical protein
MTQNVCEAGWLVAHVKVPPRGSQRTGALEKPRPVRARGLDIQAQRHHESSPPVDSSPEVQPCLA